MKENVDKVSFYRDVKHEWRWKRISSANGQVVGASHESYINRDDCIKNFYRSLSENYEITA